MKTTSFDDGWAVGPRWSLFTAGTGPAPEPVRVTLPHDAVIGLPRDPSGSGATGFFPGGVFEYVKTFAVPDEWESSRVVLRFEGIYRSAMVYVNDDFAGSQPSGYSELYVSLDEFLRFGEENTVKVQCTVHDDSRWYSGGGVYRGVSILIGGEVHIAPDGVTVTTPEVDGEGATVVVETEVENRARHPRTVVVSTTVSAPDGSVVAEQAVPLTMRPTSTAIAHQRVHLVAAPRWSVDEPNLHTCRIQLLDGDEVVDEELTTFGVRTLALDPRHGLRINGETVKLRGACIHHDNGVIGAATIGRAEERRVEILKAAGFNALRSAHNPMSRAMLDACDRLGMLVMDEAFDMWTVTKTDHDHALRFPDRWESDVDSMVRKDRNHSSIVLYSIGNEIPETTGRLGATLARDIASRIRSLDPTRFTVNSVNPLVSMGPALFADMAGELAPPEPAPEAATEPVDPPPGDVPRDANTVLAMMKGFLEPLMAKESVGKATEEAYAGVDVAGYNYLHGRYAMDVQAYPERIIVGSETYPIDIDQNWALVEEHSQLIGDFTWTGWDYLGEAGIGRIEYRERGAEPAGIGVHASYPAILAGCGDIDITGHRRPASYFREVVFGLRAAPYIAVQRPEHHDDEIAFLGPWSWSDSIAGWSWAGHEGAPIVVEVYSASDEVELLVNGGSLGRAGAGREHRYKAEFETVYEPGEVVAVAYTDGNETDRTVLRSATGPVVLTATADRSQIRADHTDLAFVEIALVDAEGNLHHTADRPVTVTIDGPAVLQGFGTALPAPTEAFTDATRTTCDGRALAVIRPTGPGAITVTVEAEGCDSVTVPVEATAFWSAGHRPTAAEGRSEV